MKTSLLILAITACACAAYTRPDAEESSVSPKNNKKVLIDLDELATQLRTKFADEEFLMEKFGDRLHTFSADKGLSTIADNNGPVLVGGWASKIPWGTIIDVVVQIVKKATE